MTKKEWDSYKEYLINRVTAFRAFTQSEMYNCNDDEEKKQLQNSIDKDNKFLNEFK